MEMVLILNYLLSRKRLKLCLGQNFYFGQASSNINQYETTTNTSHLIMELGVHSSANHLIVELGVHSEANSFWQPLSELGHPRSPMSFSSGWEACWSHLLLIRLG